MAAKKVRVWKKAPPSAFWNTFQRGSQESQPQKARPNQCQEQAQSKNSNAGNQLTKIAVKCRFEKLKTHKNRY
ncbi:hypothetical protein AYR62_15020 [Secundilactobacillus paracollinoides]|uniref:Uncharacterized protein n=1 Tax=Secundilactobacillus paracollinoides TaxID=240427 RepID=A0A1B2IXH8_9LACO|nr:hypothetical protein AYR61_05635 [Secundilactobacillus paracollinoides]ANZ65260.1 hypothetical protein AYR62_15020 [Secundilactobacillus paracollinoides]ANZ66730.1 hypothetical protein AYR63_06005 [Secundilactobacillus paracollinoides]